MDLNKVFKIRSANEEGNKWMITIGNHLATEEVFEDKEKAEEKIKQTDWNLVAALIKAIEEADKIKEESNKEKEV